MSIRTSPYVLGGRHIWQTWCHIVRVFRLSQRFDCEISPMARFTGADENLRIGRGTKINAYCNLRFRKGTIAIGANVLLAQSVTILANSHRFEDRDTLILNQGELVADVKVGDDVWIGVNAVIMPGVRIGDGAVVGANSVVTRNVGAYEVWAGIPAKKIKDRGEPGRSE
jgi:acetyltransferase-like isoleucine patch superfamily enzyme